MNSSMEARMGEQSGWLTFWEDDFGAEVDEAVMAGRITPEQAEYVWQVFEGGQDETTCRQALNQVLAQAAAGMGAPVVGAGPTGGMPMAGPPQLAAPAGMAPAEPMGGMAPMAAPMMAPAAAGPAATGKIMTMVVRQVPGLPPDVKSVTPGGVALYSRDLSAAQRVKRVGKKIAKVFPKRPRKRTVFKKAGSAIA